MMRARKSLRLLREMCGVRRKGSPEDDLRAAGNLRGVAMGDRKALAHAWDGELEHLFDAVYEEELHLLPHGIRQLTKILLVSFGENHALHSSPAGGEHLLLHTADRQHQAGQRNLTRHRG